MKIILTILCTLAFNVCFSQGDALLKAQVATIPRGTKQIVLTVDSTFSDQSVFKGVLSYLMDQGYEIDNMDKELGMIQTKEKNLKYAWSTRFTVLIGNHKVRLKGKAILELGSDSAYDIENKGSLGDMYVQSFRELVRLANGLPHKSMDYIR